MDACRLCGRQFRPRAGGPVRYCARCGKKADREVGRVHRVRCKECGGAFETPNRSILYCSDACRKKRHARRRRIAIAAAASAPAAPPPAGPQPAAPASPPGRMRTVKCRICGGAFQTDMRPGNPHVYCSPPCRAEGKRARMREYMRRYLADPERRAVHAARLRASTARRRARDGRDEVPRMRCKECAREFSPASRSVRYCSDPCRKKGLARVRAACRRRREEREGRPATVRCRVCSREFAPVHGDGMPRIYCSLACRAEGRRAYFRERVRRLRGSGS